MNSADKIALIISVSRRNARILIPPHNFQPARVLPKIKNLVVGDFVKIEEKNEVFLVDQVLDRKNCLSRSYAGRIKEIASNLDQLFIVTAPGELFNTIFIDRVLLVATLREIPCTLIINKIDLADETLTELLKPYTQLGLDIVHTSAKTPTGLNALQEVLQNPSWRALAFAGMSGVGKSTILNRLIPNANQRTAEVSDRTGKGRQTTTLAEGYIYERQNSTDLLLIDLPGIQNFGVSGVERKAVKLGFAEFSRYSQACEFHDCMHTAEPKCAVKDAVRAGEIAHSRYQSYVEILAEVERFKAF